MDDAVVGFGTGLDHLVAEPVSLDQQAAHRFQRPPHERLPAGETAGESYAEHWCFSASATVLAISMAMVSGPTPPGTGV